MFSENCDRNHQLSGTISHVVTKGLYDLVNTYMDTWWTGEKWTPFGYCTCHFSMMTHISSKQIQYVKHSPTIIIIIVTNRYTKSVVNGSIWYHIYIYMDDSSEIILIIVKSPKQSLSYWFQKFSSIQNWLIYFWINNVIKFSNKIN